MEDVEEAEEAEEAEEVPLTLQRRRMIVRVGDGDGDGDGEGGIWTDKISTIAGLGTLAMGTASL